VKQEDWQKIKDLLQRMASDINNASGIAANFVQTNPALIGVLIGVGIAEITTGLIGEIVSAGTATVPATALAVSGAILVTVALQNN
jgi:hypothetical protein